MPRTKQGRKPKQIRNSLEESDLFVKDFERQTQLQIAKMEAEAKLEIKSLETFIDLTLSRLPVEIRQLTLGEILSLNEDDEKENSNEVTLPVNDQTLSCASAIKRNVRKTKRGTTISDDGYVTEGTMAAPHIPQLINDKKEASKPKAKRSSSRNSKFKKSDIIQKTAPKAKAKAKESSVMPDILQTPTNLKPLHNNFNIITPKIKPNMPINVLRRPREGEMAVSMQGSPLLISNILPDKTANINVPLSNGNVMSLLPNGGLRMSTLPALDEETINQLQTLKSHIEKVIAPK